MRAELVEQVKCFRVYVEDTVPASLPESVLSDYLPDVIEAVRPEPHWALLNCIWDDDVPGAVLIVFRILTDEFYKPFEVLLSTDEERPL